MRHLPSTDDREAHESRSAIVRGCAALADSPAFSLAIFGVILANAIVLGAETYEEDYADIGEAMLTMFVLLSLENLPTYIDEARGVSGWAVPFFVSYVLLAAFLVFNFFIGVIVNSMERAREIEADRDAAERAEHGEPPAEPGLRERLAEIRRQCDELESSFRRSEA